MTKNRGNWIPIKFGGDLFIEECRKIAKNNNNEFSSFKQNPTFCKVIGNDIRSQQVCDSLYNKLKTSKLFDYIDKFKTNDSIGLPKQYYYPDIGNISPGTLYFIEILSDIVKKFDDIHNFNVLEIGSGYGGQAKIILDYGVKNYTCIDVSGPLDLCKKYLNHFNYENTTFIGVDELDSVLEFSNYDLVISNWCLSEFDIPGLSFYVDKIIKFIDRGYFLMNMWDTERKLFLFNELAKHYKTISVEPESVNTFMNNNFILSVKR